MNKPVALEGGVLKKMASVINSVKALREFHRDELLGAARRVVTEYKKLRVEQTRTEKHNARRYNLITMRGLERYEVGFYSPFIADLLEPFGTHGQGCLFLRRFFELVDKKASLAKFAPLIQIEDLHPGEWLIQREKMRIDISIRNSKESVAVFIENKIGAPDQENQLARYRESLQATGYRRTALIYLSPTGGDLPTSGKPDVHLTYDNDIREWISTCLKDISAPRACANLEQFLEAVDSMLGR